MNTQELTHRINFCAKAVKALGIGTIEIDILDEYHIRYNIVSKRGLTIISFKILEGLERHLEKLLERRPRLDCPDPTFCRRLKGRRQERLATTSGRISYPMRSAL